MDNRPAASRYDRLYDATRANAFGWSSARLAIALPLMMRRGEKSESAWGAIDAIADLLGQITPPSRRS
jgi:hypothetical protein